MEGIFSVSKSVSAIISRKIILSFIRYVPGAQFVNHLYIGRAKEVETEKSRILLEKGKVCGSRREEKISLYFIQDR